MPQETMERTDGMELRVIINLFARASVLSQQETERLRLGALKLVDDIEGDPNDIDIPEDY